MKFVKENMVLVVCGVVLLLAILWATFLNGMVLTEPFVDGPVKKELGNRDLAAKTLARFPVLIPKVIDLKGPPEKEIIERGKAIIADWEKYSGEIVKMGSVANRAHYVTVTGSGAGEHVVPRLNNVSLDGLLPKVTRGESQKFKAVYGELFESVWPVKLVGTAQVPGVPPEYQKLKEEYAKKQAAAGPVGGAGGMGGMAGVPGGLDQKAENDFVRKSVFDRASEIHMYLDTAAFQMRDWLPTPNPPTEQQMFEALVDSWFQGDVVTAISLVNENEFKSRRIPPQQWSVEVSPIKRLEGIVVGSGAESVHLAAPGQGGVAATPSGPISNTAAGELFYRGPSGMMSVPITPGMPVDANSAQQPTGPGAANTIDRMRSLTGRASGLDYDVVLMSITVDMDPLYYNKLIDQLYRTNIGYTVLNVEARTVDPLEAASSGFIYGSTQVMQVRILVEGLLFRKWTLPLMPESLRAPYGIPAPEAPK